MSTSIDKTFPHSLYTQRISRAQKLCRERSLAGVIVGTGPELAYLTGSWISSHERLTALTIPATGQPRLVAPMTDIGALELDGVDIVGWQDGDAVYELAVAPLGSGTVGVGSSLTADHVLTLQSLLDEHSATVLATDVLAELFMSKDEAELEQLRFAGGAIDRVHAQVPSLLRAGRTEREVAADLEQLILEEHDVVDFVIVGSGPNGSNPHHSFSDRVLEEGDPVVVDLGGTVGVGYHSDCTRTYQVGEVTNEEFLRAYSVLQQAQQAACDAVRPGITAGELDAVARDIITEAGFGQWFTHRLGHGIGLAMHEAPFIISGNDVVLQEGIAFSIEPGIYKPGEWGMRIEDIVVVGYTQAEYLNFQPKDLR